MKELDRCVSIERSIITTYRKTLWNPFVAGVKRYHLISPGDKIAVCISGGKDSMVMAKLLQELQRHSDVPFDLVFLSMDPGYNPANRVRLEENAKTLGLDLQIFETDVFDVADSVEEHSPCYLCARMRRGYLYAHAKELGCNKIALGHHLNDVIETTLLAMLWGSQLQGMQPMLHSTNFDGMTLIRPLYCVRENDIIAWAKHNDLHFLQCACRFTEKCAEGDGTKDSKRLEVKRLIAELKKTNPNIENSLFNSIHAVCMDTFPEWKRKGEYHTFYEDFTAEEKQ